jgi:hypothetical protein
VKSALFRFISNRWRGTEDYPLKDYQLETLRMIRATSLRLRWYSTRSLCDLWNQWSTDVYSAGWIHPTSNDIQRFVQWSYIAQVREPNS